MKNLLLSAICIVSLFLSSCQNWIDVNPKTDIEAEEFFTSEDGFKSALTGLYSMMVLEKSYGRQMTFDFVEKLVQRYDNYAAGSVTDEERAAIYKYGETTSSKNAIAEIWLKLYNEIANINNFLQYLESNGDTPEDIVVEQLMGRIFPGALGKPVLGRPASLNGMTGASLRAFKEREYSPERIVVSVCGSFTEDNLARLCSRFSALAPSRPAACRKSAYTPAVVVKRKATEQNHFCLSFPGLPDGDADRFSWQVLSMALGGGMSSRLFQTVREKHGLCYSIGSFTAAYKETGMLAISTAVGRDSEEKALALIREEIEKFRQDGITDKELRTARELIKSSIILSLESSSSRMNRLGSGLLLLGKCLTADEIIERYDAVTTESVLALAREKLAPEMMGFSAVGRLAPAEDYLSVFGK